MFHRQLSSRGISNSGRKRSRFHRDAHRSYKLDLRGPAFTVQSACSTSLLAVAEACQCLLDYRADMAIAGGVSITFPQKRGYLYPGSAWSPPTGIAAASMPCSRTVFGSGAGAVLLKRLDAALADGDPICAVIRGSAVNNDGARKVGYTARERWSSEGRRPRPSLGRRDRRRHFLY